MATILNIVNKISMPDIAIPHGSLTGNSFHVTDAPQDDLFSPMTNNSIQIQVTDLEAELKVDTLKYDMGFLTATGSALAHISNLTVGVQVGLQNQTLSDGKVVPAFEILNSTVLLPAESINLTLQGSFIVTLADILQPLFIG